VHVTLSVDPNLPQEGLRRPDLTACIEDCLREIRETWTVFSVVHFSIQRHHLHLVVEAANRNALSRGMQGVAKRINKVLGRRGKVFIDRYFETVVKSPRQARHVLS
jgi:hypothetical protein